MCNSGSIFLSWRDLKIGSVGSFADHVEKSIGLAGVSFHAVAIEWELEICVLIGSTRHNLPMHGEAESR